MGANPIFPATPKNYGITLLPADTTTAKTLVTAGASGSIVDVMTIISTDTAAMIVVLQLYDGSTAYDLNEVLVPIGSGTNGTAKSINGLNVTDTPAFGNREDRSIYLQTGWSLRARMKATITADKVVTVAGCYGDF